MENLMPFKGVIRVVEKYRNISFLTIKTLICHGDVTQSAVIHEQTSTKHLPIRMLFHL